MLRRIRAFLCMAVFLITTSVQGYCAPSAYINIVGKSVRLSTAPIEADGTVFYPIAEIAKALGMTVSGGGSAITAEVNDHCAEFTAESSTAVVDMVTVSARCPYVRNNDIMVEEDFFLNYMKYMGFVFEKREVLTVTQVSEITEPEDTPTEDEFYSSLETDCELIGEEQLFTATKTGSISAVKTDIDDLDGYTKALTVTTTKEPTAVYDYQLIMTPKADLPSGRFALVSYYARALEISDESGCAYIGPCYEQKTGDYKKAGSANQEIAQDGWSRHWLLLSAGSLDFTRNGSQFNIRLGYKPQTVQIAGLRVMRLAADYTKEDVSYSGKAENTYFGREDGALWRDEALDRIEKYRVCDIKVTAKNENGNPVQGAAVDLKMNKNEFMFGTAVHDNLLQASTAANASEKSKKYAEKVEKYFNTVVFDTAGKWNKIEENRAVYASGIYNWAAERGIDVRGHALFWDGPEHYSASFAAARQNMTDEEQFWRVEEHINENMTYFGDRIGQWDLLNEPLANRTIINRVGMAKTAELFKCAKAIEPTVSLYVNETGINGNHTNWQQVKKLRNFVSRLKENGAPIDGIGVQAHCGNALRYPQEFYNQLDYLAEAADEIAVTEYDFTVSDESLAADNLRDMLIAAYSQPKCTGFLTWGFWDDQHWKNNAPFFDSSWNEKEALSVWKELVLGEWKTSKSGVTDADGVFETRGHRGEYTVTVTHGENTASAVFDTKSGGNVYVTVSDGGIEIAADSIPQEKQLLDQTQYLKLRTNLNTGEKMPVYQQPEEYDESITQGAAAGVQGVWVYDDFTDYGTDGKDEEGRYINPVCDENVWGRWYGEEAAAKRGTVLSETDGEIYLSFYRQNNPIVLKSKISRVLQPNCFAIDTENRGYKMSLRFYIPFGDKQIGLRYGRYAAFALAQNANDESEAFCGIYSNSAKPQKPMLKYGGKQTELCENVWYDLELHLIPDGMGGMIIGGSLSDGNNKVELDEGRTVLDDDLRFLNMTVNCYNSETYTRAAFYLSKIEFCETDYTKPVSIDGQTAEFISDSDRLAAAAVYEKQSGKLLEAKLKDAPQGEETRITLDTALDTGVFARAFLWEHNLSPYAAATTEK